MPGNIDLYNNDAVIADISVLMPIWVCRIIFMKVAAISASFTSDMKNVMHFLWCYFCVSCDGKERFSLKVAKMRASIMRALFVCRLSGGKTVMHKELGNERESNNSQQIIKYLIFYKLSLNVFRFRFLVIGQALFLCIAVFL